MMKQMSERGPRKRGFTMVEVMVAAALLSVCTAMAMAGFIRVINATVASVKCAEMHRELRNGLARMSRDVMEAEVVYDYGSGTFLILQKPLSTGGIVYVYYLVYENYLYRFQSNRPGSEILGDNFAYLKARYYDLNGDPITSINSATLVQIYLGGKATNRGVTYTDQVETRVRLRNKQV